MTALLTRRMATVPQGTHQVDLRRYSRDESDDHRGQKCYGEREQEHGAVDLDADSARRETTDESDEQIEPAIGQEETRRSADERQQRGFDECLLDEPRAPGAESCSDGHFAIAPHEARDREIRHVGASDQEHECGGSEQNEKCGPSVPRELVLERCNGNLVAAFLRIGFGIVELEAFGQSSEIRPGRLPAWHLWRDGRTR